MKAVVAAFNQEKALVGAFSVIVQLHRWIALRHWSLACPCPGTTQGAGGNLSPKICGVNTGSHIYIDAGAGRDTQAALTAVISEAATWNIKVTTQSSYRM